MIISDHTLYQADRFTILLNSQVVGFNLLSNLCKSKNRHAPSWVVCEPFAAGNRGGMT